MPTATALWGFIAVAAVVLLVPGPSVVFIVTRSMERGRRAGIYSMLGLETGALLHAIATAAGLSAILASSKMAITFIRLAGSAYLLYLGTETIVNRGGWGQSSTSALHRRRYFRDGLLVDLFNPKTALFFIAFLPQFVQADRGAACATAINVRTDVRHHGKRM